MSVKVTYHLGGYFAAAPAQNKAEQWDSGTALYTRWNAAGVQQEQRALTGPEAAELAAQDAASTIETNRETIRGRAQTALAVNDAFLAKPLLGPTPTNAQVIARVRELEAEAISGAKQRTGLIRLLLNQLDTTNGT